MIYFFADGILNGKDFAALIIYLLAVVSCAAVVAVYAFRTIINYRKHRTLNKRNVWIVVAGILLIMAANLLIELF